jgi:hypothetical protein
MRGRRLFNFGATKRDQTRNWPLGNSVRKELLPSCAVSAAQADWMNVDIVCFLFRTLNWTGHAKSCQPLVLGSPMMSVPGLAKAMFIGLRPPPTTSSWV